MLAARPAHAQQPPKQHSIAFVHSGISADLLTETGGTFWVRRFFEELRSFGYSDGRNLSVERHSAEGQRDRFPDLAQAVVSRSPQVIVANSNPLAAAFRAASATIPIVAIMSDPIKFGLVGSLARPGDNLTGVSIDAGIEIWSKRLQILKEAVPAASKAALLAARAEWEGAGGEVLRNTGQGLGVSVTWAALDEVTPEHIRRVFADISSHGLDALIVSASGEFVANRRLIVELAERARVPMMCPYRDFAELGGMLAFGPDLAELARHMADQVRQILDGAKPGDIPIYQASKFELVVNLKTARAMGVAIPSPLLVLANEVIE